VILTNVDGRDVERLNERDVDFDGADLLIVDDVVFNLIL
jgi:hypothetical protein